jgi:hypothetical protein
MRIKVGFTVPNGIKNEDTVAWKSFKALPKMPGIEIAYTIATGACIGINRNVCITNGKSNKVNQTEFDFDFMLFVDYDIEFISDDIIRLLNFNLPIVSGSYRRKEDPRFIHAGYWKDNLPGMIDTGITSDVTGIKEVDWIGGGFLLISKEVFQKMEYPYFRYVVVNYEKNDEMYADNATEDFGFCIKAKECGFKIHCDCDTKVKHHDHVEGVSSNRSKVYMIKTDENGLRFLIDTLNQVMVKGENIPLWVGMINSIKDARTSIS